MFPWRGTVEPCPCMHRVHACMHAECGQRFLQCRDHRRECPPRRRGVDPRGSSVLRGDGASPLRRSLAVQGYGAAGRGRLRVCLQPPRRRLAALRAAAPARARPAAHVAPGHAAGSFPYSTAVRPRLPRPSPPALSRCSTCNSLAVKELPEVNVLKREGTCTWGEAMERIAQVVFTHFAHQPEYIRHISHITCTCTSSGLCCRCVHGDKAEGGGGGGGGGVGCPAA